jgi:hypothetical protein
MIGEKNLQRALLYHNRPIVARGEVDAGATASTIPLKNVRLVTNQLVGYFIEVISGALTGQWSEITANDATTLTISPALTDALAENDQIVILKSGTVEQNIAEWGGTAVTGRDITLDIQMLQNLDLAITALRDALRGADSRTLTDLYNYLARYSQLPTDLLPPGT